MLHPFRSDGLPGHFAPFTNQPYSTICNKTCCPDLEAAAFKRFLTAVIVCPLRPITFPTSDLRISTLKINLRPCSTFVTRTSSGASTSCLMTNSRKVSTGKSLNRQRGSFFAGLQNDARDRGTGLSAVRHPIINAAEVQVKIFTRHARIVVPDRFNKFPVARTAFVRHHHTIERTVFSPFSPQSNRNSHI
jgi:hypothetical protein